MTEYLQYHSNYTHFICLLNVINLKKSCFSINILKNINKQKYKIMFKVKLMQRKKQWHKNFDLQKIYI